MWRYLAVLCAGLFLTLLIAGKDDGQVRQGLLLEPIHKPLGTPATAVAAKAPAPKADADVAMATFVPVAAPAAAPEPEPVPAPAPEPVPVAVTPDAELPALSLAFEEPVADLLAPEPARASNVFSIADTPPADPAAQQPAAQPVAETAAAPAGILWVSANSVNVREGPGTDFGVAGRLTRGEAVTVVGDAGDGWLQIRIEGDGLEGYVASRLLSATSP